MRAVVIVLSLFLAAPPVVSGQDKLDTDGLIRIDPESGEPIRRAPSPATIEQQARKAERTTEAWERWAHCIIGNLDKAHSDRAAALLQTACLKLHGLP